MANYADLLNVLYLYSHSLRGSTVLPTIPWVRDCVISVHSFHSSQADSAALLKPPKILLQKFDIFD